MPLNDLQIKRSKPAAKAYKLNDENGLYLYITPAGGKSFRFDYAMNGKRATLTIGKYPAVSLSEARAAAEQARNQIANGINPAEKKKQAKQEQKARLLNTFEHLARQWYAANLHRWKSDNAARIMGYLEKDVFPYIGDKQLDDVRVADVKDVLLRVIERNAAATAEKIRQWIAAVYDYAAILELTDRNPARVLHGVFAKPPTQHLPALPQDELVNFYKGLMTAHIEPKSRLAILLLMLLFPRSTEFRGGKWCEIDFQAAIWTIPAERMKHEKNKPKPPLVIPLSTWAIELLHELRELTGNTPYLFPSRTAQNGVMSETTLNNIIKKLGYNGIATPHGFRSLASSILNEKGFNPDAIERQLAHIPHDKIRAAYNRAEYMAERTEFMQWYSDHLKQHYDQATQQIQAA